MHRFVSILAVCIFLLCFTAQALAFFPGQEKIVDPELLREGKGGGFEGEPHNIIVSLSQTNQLSSKDFKGNIKVMRQNQAMVAALVDSVLSKSKSLKTIPNQRLQNLPIFSISVDDASLRELASLNEVVAIYKDRPMELFTVQGIPQINPGTYRDSYGGKGVGIAIIDSGINYEHPALGGASFPNDKVIDGYNTALHSSDPMDILTHNGQAAHGSSCAGIAAGKRMENGDFVGGVAPEAALYALRVADMQGLLVTSAIMMALDWCVTHQYDHRQAPIMIISMSLGASQEINSPCDEMKNPFKAVVDMATANGITVFAASGNDGFTQGIAPPACLSNAISVGAIYDTDLPAEVYSCDTQDRRKGEVCCYSNSGQILDLLAPSSFVTTAIMPGDRYTKTFDGTSAACPYAAGAAAVIQSYYKEKTGKFLTPAELKYAMTNNGTPTIDSRNGIKKPLVNITKTIQSFDISSPSDDESHQNLSIDDIKNALGLSQ